MRNGKAKIAIASAAVLGFIVISYFFFDIPITFFCKRLDRRVTDFFGIVTEFGISTWYLAGSLGFFLLFTFVRRQKLYAYRALFLFASIAASGVINNIIKVIIGRYRPEMLFEKGLYGLTFFKYADGLTSFPSGHTATVFSLALALSILFPRSRVFLFCFALVVGASRVIITSHYLSDVVAGAYVGIISVFLLRQAFPFLERKTSSLFKF
jgi:membrane-associated phospholipid phosphatase